MEWPEFCSTFLRNNSIVLICDINKSENYIASFSEISIGKARVGIIHCSANFAAKGERWTGEGKIARCKTSKRGNFGVSRRTLRGYQRWVCLFKITPV
jgi:hypothetical protein